MVVTEKLFSQLEGEGDVGLDASILQHYLEERSPSRLFGDVVPGVVAGREHIELAAVDPDLTERRIDVGLVGEALIDRGQGTVGDSVVEERGLRYTFPALARCWLAGLPP